MLRSVSSGDQCGWLGAAARKQYNFVHNLYKWIFYNVAMTEMVTLLDPTIALALPNEDSGSANGRISFTYLVCWGT